MTNAAAARRSITETPNPLTQDIDVASPIGIVRLLRAADGQMFSGFDGNPGLLDEETIQALARLAREAARILSLPTGRVIMSGAGTSGRLAMFTARAFNLSGGEEKYAYTIAGGNAALIQAQEGAEDDPQQGVRDLEQAAAGAGEIFYVGITCGLSAPYIAGQLDHMLAGKLKGHAVLLGFNPVELSRDTPIEGWDQTFRQVAQHTESAGNATVLNPVVGPEPITGSTRMKSGSATKILLEVLFHAATALVMDPEEEDDDDDDKPREDSEIIPYIRMLLREYENAVREVYFSAPQIAELIEAGGDALRAGGHIYYLGGVGAEPVHSCQDDDCDHDDHDHDHNHGSKLAVETEAGILGLIDASECPPTYGADFEDVRGFLSDGWAGLLPNSGVDMSAEGSPFRVGLEDFRRDKLPKLSANDLVVILGDFEGSDDLLHEAEKRGAKTAAVRLSSSAAKGARDADIMITFSPNIVGLFSNTDDDDDRGGKGGESSGEAVFAGPTQLAIKLILNALTTGAHILAGKVFGNRMVDLRISNNKLFHRTVGIISDLMSVPQDTARDALVRSTYETDTLTPAHQAAHIRDHIEAAKKVDKVVPKALLIATGKYTYAEAAAALRKNPIVRTAIGEYVKGS